MISLCADVQVRWLKALGCLSLVVSAGRYNNIIKFDIIKFDINFLY